MHIRLRNWIAILAWLMVLGPGVSSSLAWYPGEPIWRTEDKYNEVLAQLRKAIPKQEAAEATKARTGLRAFFSRKTDAEKLQQYLKTAQEALDPTKKNKDARNHYRDFLTALREGNRVIQNSKVKGGQSPTTLEPLKNSFAQMTRALYTQVDLHPFNDQLVCGVSEGGRELIGDEETPPSQPHGNDNLDYARRKVDFLSQVFQRVRANPQIHFFQRWAQSYDGEFTYGNLDPNMQANLISVKNTFIRRDGTKLLALRIPSQTIGSSKNAAISPEFKGYLDSLEEKGERHTYINLQNIRENARGKSWAPTLVSDERNRCRALHNFSDTQNNLVLITLSKNSNFHSQKGKSALSNMDYDSLQSFADFKEEMLAQFVPKNEDDWKHTGIRLNDLWNPNKWKPQDFEGFHPPRNTLLSIQELYKTEVRRNLEEKLDALGRSFGWTEKLNLNKEQRKGLIELSYDLVSDYASRSSYSSNKSCKDAIDRGGGANALAYFSTALRQMCSENPSAKLTSEFQKKMDALPGILFSDALQTRKRAIIEERLESFQNAARLLVEGVRDQGCYFFNNGCKNGKGNCLRNQYTYQSLGENKQEMEVKNPKEPILRNSCKYTEAPAPAACLTQTRYFKVSEKLAALLYAVERAQSEQDDSDEPELYESDEL